MRAIEMFQDLNHDDMDVSAPPSSRDYHKEAELAESLNRHLTQLIESGFFDDCSLRGELCLMNVPFITLRQLAN